MSDIDALLAAQAAGPKSTMTGGDPLDTLLAAQARSTPAEPASVSAGKAINANLDSIPRQLGLTARYGLEGLANTAQIFTEPVASLMRAGGIKTKSLGEMATGLSDAMGLPSPQTANERVIGDATRLVAGSGGMMGATSAASKLPGMLGSVMSGLSANPASQIGAATGSGLLGGASREAGGSPMTQTGASLAGGVLGGLAPGGASGLLDAVKQFATPKMTPQQLDMQLTAVLGKAGQDYAQLPFNVKSGLRAELATSLQAGKELDPAAVARLADFKTVGATPTRGMVSQDPVQITREMNLAKISANSGDSSLHGLPLLQNRNNNQLINRLNDAGGRSDVNGLQVGQAVNNRIATTYAGLQNTEQIAWDRAKSLPGYTQPIFPDSLNAAMRSVGDDALTGFLPKPITDYMAAFQTGQQPFTPQHYKNLRSMLSGELAKGGNEAAAAQSAIRGMDSVPMRPLTETGRDIGSTPVTMGMAEQLRNLDAQPQTAIDAINQARAASAAKYRYADSSPLVRTSLSGNRSADPEKITQSFVINGTLNDSRSVANEVGPQGIQTIRDGLANYIKKQALSGASDETGKVSQSALNTVLRKIGDDKLGLFFSPEEIAGLKATGRVASYMQSQPVGSAVNNSNSGALVLGRSADVVGAVAGKFLLGKQLIADPLRNINISLSQRGAQNVVPGLLIQQPKQPLGQSLLLPGLATAGGLHAP